MSRLKLVPRPAEFDTTLAYSLHKGSGFLWFNGEPRSRLRVTQVDDE